LVSAPVASHQGDATGAETKKGELTSRKSHKPVEGKERSADDTEDNTKGAKSGQVEWEETNEEVT